MSKNNINLLLNLLLHIRFSFCTSDSSFIIILQQDERRDAKTTKSKGGIHKN